MESQAFFRSIQDKYRLLESEGYSFFLPEVESFTRRGFEKISKIFKTSRPANSRSTKSFNDIIDVSIVIPAFGKNDVVIKCVEYIGRSVGINPLITVVDNGCPEEIAKALRSFPLVTNIIRNDENRGYGQGCDQGIKSIDSKFCVLLNSDALVQPDAIRLLIDTLSENENIAVAVSLSLNTDETIQELGRVVKSDGHTLGVLENTPKEQIDIDAIKSVPYSSFVCVAVNVEDYLNIGGFDEKFSPAYSEDVDLCIRLWSASKAVVVNTNSVVSHAGGVASSELKDLSLIKSRNVEYLKKKHSALLDAEYSDVDINNYPHELNLLFGKFFNRKILVFVNSEIDIAELESIIKIESKDWVFSSIFVFSDVDQNHNIDFRRMGVEIINTSDFRKSHHFLRNRIGYFDEIVLNFGAATHPFINMVFNTQPFAKYTLCSRTNY